MSEKYLVREDAHADEKGRRRTQPTLPPITQKKTEPASASTPKTTPRNVVAASDNDFKNEPDLPTAPEYDSIERRPSHSNPPVSTPGPEFDSLDRRPSHSSPPVSSHTLPSSSQKYAHTTSRPIRFSLQRESKRLLKSAALLLSRMSKQRRVSFALIILGMLSETATPVPRHNVPIGITLVTRSTDSFDHRLVVSGLCFGVLLDLIWLLRPQEGCFNGYFLVDLDRYSRIWLVMCLLAKAYLVMSTYFVLEPEKQQASSAPIRRHVWDRIRFFLPRKTLPRPSQLSHEVLMRVIMLVWIHAVAGIVLFVLAMTALIFYANTIQFRSTTLGAPLYVAMLFKATTSCATFITAADKLNFYGCFMLSGCSYLARYDAASANQPIVLKYGRAWARRVKYAKTVDLVFGAYLSLVYYAAFRSGTFFARNGVTTMLSLTGVIIIVLDLWTPLLIVIAVRCGIALHRHHRQGSIDVDPYFPNQLEYDDESGESEEGSDSEDEEENEESSESEPMLDAMKTSSHSDGSSHSRRMQGHQNSASNPFLQMACGNEGLGNWVRQIDENGRAYLVHTMSGTQIWESEPSVEQNELPAAQNAPFASPRATSPRVTVNALAAETPRNYSPIVADYSHAVEAPFNSSSWVAGNASNTEAPRALSARSAVNNTTVRTSRALSARETSNAFNAGTTRTHSPRFTSNISFAEMHRTLTPTLAVNDAAVETPTLSAEENTYGPTEDAPSTIYPDAAVSTPIEETPRNFSHQDTEDAPLAIASTTHSPRIDEATSSVESHSVPLLHLERIHSVQLPLLDKASTPSQSVEQYSTRSSDIEQAGPRDNAESPEDLWSSLPDGGNFACQVSRVPSSGDLLAHLINHGFQLVSDAETDSKRRVLFYYPNEDEVECHFLGELVFEDLFLRASFKCTKPSIIPSIIKKLQLKSLVGKYIPLK